MGNDEQFTEKNGFFMAVCVTKEDIASALGAEGDKKMMKKIEALSDDDMRRIASKLNETVCEMGVYWDFLKNFVPDMLEG
jgi:hypothetical protein